MGHWQRREAAIKDNNRVKYSILVTFTEFEINQTNIRRDIAILSIATPGLYVQILTQITTTY